MKKVYQIRRKKKISGTTTLFVEDHLFESFDDAARELERIEDSYIHLVENLNYDCSEDRTSLDDGEKLKWFQISSDNRSYECWVQECEVLPTQKKYLVSVQYHTCVQQEVFASNEEEAKKLFDESIIDFNNEILNECETSVKLIR